MWLSPIALWMKQVDSLWVKIIIKKNTRNMTRNILLTFFGLLALSSIVREIESNKCDAMILRESIHTLEDMKEWMKYDIESGVIDSINGEAYILNINETLNTLRQW